MNLMTHIARRLACRFHHEQAGATSIEYALIALLIGMAIIGGVTLLGVQLQNPFAAVSAGLP